MGWDLCKAKSHWFIWSLTDLPHWNQWDLKAFSLAGLSFPPAQRRGFFLILQSSRLISVKITEQGKGASWTGRNFIPLTCSNLTENWVSFVAPFFCDQQWQDTCADVASLVFIIAYKYSFSRILDLVRELNYCYHIDFSTFVCHFRGGV